MHTLIREVQKASLKKVPEVKTGYTVRVHQKIKEGNKERVQAFEGLVIKVGHGEGVEKTITVRKIVQGIGVEKVFPVNSPNITKIEVKKKAKVRRAKLYYMRERSGKSARLQERHVTEAERAAEEEKMEAMIQEAVSADEKRKKEEAAAEGETGDSEQSESETEAPAAEPSDDTVTPEPEADAEDATEKEESEKESEPEAESDADTPDDAPQTEDADKEDESDASAAEPAETNEGTDTPADEEEKAA